MKARLLICLTAFFQPLLANATEVSVFEVKIRTKQVSLEAIGDNVDSDSDHTKLSMYAPDKKIKSFKLGEESLSNIFEKAEQNKKGQRTVFGKVKRLLLRDDQTKSFYMVYLEDETGRFRISPMKLLADDWFIPTRYLYQSQNAVILQHLKAP